MWDTIVIGSGIGGLGAAAALAKAGQRVLVLEQHTVAGGQTQTFRRGDWEFATGVHYLGGCGPDPGAGGQFGRLLSWLSDGALQFAPSANPYDIIRLPDGFAFGIPHPQTAYREALVARFPGEQVAIDGWFAAINEAQRAAMTLMMSHTLPPWLAWGLRLLRGGAVEQWLQRTLADELSRIAHPQLRAVLGARWGDYGAAPDQAPFIEHAIVTSSYDAGAWYPVGGPARFAQTLLPGVLAAGGECRLGARVHSIELQGGRAHGVRGQQDGRPFTAQARQVISDIGLLPTLACLEAGVAPQWQAAATSLQPGLGCIALYLGLEGDIAAAGATSANEWVYETVDVGRVWRRPADEDAPGFLVSFPSLKDPSWAGPPTAEVLALVDVQAFAPWLREGASGGDYSAFKDWVAERLFAQFESHFPALAQQVRFKEAATPVTQQRYVGTPAGAMYGLEMSRERLDHEALRLRTPVPGLLLTGQDVAGPGVQPSFMAGLMAAATVVPRLWREMGR
ncbi:MAG: NAD(P)/FAD-dependent oxidoreductase [Rubrivivax sp.]|nr:NAD(P)/FAD-dependent oxidoreductase [Rubrivivax sp.]